MTTRGRGKGLLLRLEQANEEAEIRVHIEPTRELAGSPGAQDRDLADLTAEDLILRLGDLEEGRGSRDFQVVRNNDAVRLQLVSTLHELDQTFEYTDLSSPKSGDYYYVRVVRFDGAMAWSSPWSVGERKNR